MEVACFVNVSCIYFLRFKFTKIQCFENVIKLVAHLSIHLIIVVKHPTGHVNHKKTPTGSTSSSVMRESSTATERYARAVLGLDRYLEDGRMEGVDGETWGCGRMDYLEDLPISL